MLLATLASLVSAAKELYALPVIEAETIHRRDGIISQAICGYPGFGEGSGFSNCNATDAAACQDGLVDYFYNTVGPSYELWILLLRVTFQRPRGCSQSGASARAESKARFLERLGLTLHKDDYLALYNAMKSQSKEELGLSPKGWTRDASHEWEERRC
ncbi:hypothetical protein CERZMDRAFT_89394 [Cercospora zeae-maydis SCOH1-5]|uniref:Uncharacterized protein n=1 Tax=Cercospora zeae-maydis SCOH1-5 TaxID=717836 RepID=A0A6A6EY51_9PEZI|nr:hypothetical protein CERZMDRAFT_89394 [Cercospora zeae-maydis SCOH1-5]